MTTPWGGMLRTALGMGLGPEAFWRLSLREWRWLTARPEGAAPMGRGELDRMAAAWPDEGGGGPGPFPASRSRSPSPRDGEET